MRLSVLVLAALVAAPAFAQPPAEPAPAAPAPAPAAAPAQAPAPAAKAPETATPAAPPADPCILTDEERGLQARMERAMSNSSPAPILVDPATGQRIGGCTVWKIEIDSSGSVKTLELLRGRANAEHVNQAQRWLRGLTFLRFSQGWTAIYLMRTR